MSAPAWHYTTRTIRTLSANVRIVRQNAMRLGRNPLVLRPAQPAPTQLTPRQFFPDPARRAPSKPYIPLFIKHDAIIMLIFLCFLRINWLM